MLSETSSNYILIVGLGNPGLKYQNTRHNAGFLVMDKLALKLNTEPFKLNKTLKADITKTNFKDQKIILAKPNEYMNNSGITIKRIMHYFKIDPKNLWVVQDEFALPLGKLRIVKNSSDAGHNGIKSIVAELKTQDFIRFRIGIKPDENVSTVKNEDLEILVLKDFTTAEKPILEKSILTTVAAIITTLESDYKKAMNIYND